MARLELLLANGTRRNCQANDTPAWRVNAINIFGNVGRTTMRGATALNVDAGLFRKVNLTERISAQFRVEAFNLANRATFLLLIGNAASPAFGIITERPPLRRRRCLARHPVTPQRLLWLPQLREPRSSLRLHPVR